MLALSSTPFSQILSERNSWLAITLVLACIWSLLRVTLTESLIGRIRVSSLLPPAIEESDGFYLGLPLVTVFDDGDVDGCRGGDDGRAGHPACLLCKIQAD